MNRPKPDTIRLWTMQPIHVWKSHREQGVLLADPNHPDIAENIADFLPAYDWLRDQMAKRIPGYTGNYPWWAYEHFLDLRFYRWNTLPREQRMIRLELAVARSQVLLSAYGSWHSVLDRRYLPAAIEWDDYEPELDAWEDEAKRLGIDLNRPHALVDPWETRLQASWERIFDVELRRPTETIQATFERLELADVVKVTEFTSM